MLHQRSPHSSLFAAIDFVVENSPRDYQLIVSNTVLNQELTHDVEGGNGSSPICFISLAKEIDLSNDAEESMQRTAVEIEQLNNIPAVVENYIYRGNECEDMSLYEMAMKTEVRPMTALQWEKYASHLDSNKITAGRQLNLKSRFQRPHSKEQTHWISFYTNDKTPVVYGTSLLVDLCRKLISRTHISSQR